MQTGISEKLNEGKFEILEPLNHILQSIRDILTTPIGTRIMRPEYGSRLMELVDSPVNEIFISRAIAATAEAIDRWEPRVTINQVKIESAGSGLIDMRLEMTVNSNNQPISQNIRISV